MFTAFGQPILADEMDVLIELRDQLNLNGIDRLRYMRRLPNSIQVSCPFHKGGQETNPSCGITTTDIKKGDRIVKAGSVHCFTCGYVSTLEEMISRMFGREDFGAFGAQWLRKNFLTVEYESRPDITLDMSRSLKNTKEEIKYVSEEELDKYRYTHPYMYKRKLTDDIIDMFDVGYDSNFELKTKNGVKNIKCVTFPVRDETGGTLFVARRSVEGKFFNYPSGVLKPIYGIYELSKLDTFPDEIIICESIFNCLTCWVYGKYAVALNGTGSSTQYEQLLKMPNRKFILGLDPDKAGNSGRRKLHDHLGKTKVITDLIIPNGKDINDLSKEEFENLEEIF